MGVFLILVILINRGLLIATGCSGVIIPLDLQSTTLLWAQHVTGILNMGDVPVVILIKRDSCVFIWECP